MTRVWIPVVLVLAFFGYPVMDRLHDVVGSVPLGLLSLTFVVMGAWLGHTTESAALAEDFRSALRVCGISQKECSIVMGISEPVLAAQLSGKEQLSFWRMACLPSAFHEALAKRTLARHGGSVVLESEALCDLVNAVQALVGDQRRPRQVA